jgi:hypothetical protein
MWYKFPYGNELRVVSGLEAVVALAAIKIALCKKLHGLMHDFHIERGVCHRRHGKMGNRRYRK